MQMWMIAMLAVSALLIVRDMAKLIFTDKKKGKPIYDAYPQKEKIERYARAFQRLAHTFYEMPNHQEQLTQTEIQDIFSKVQDQVCKDCPQMEKCWKQRENQTSQKVFSLLQVIEEGNQDRFLRAQGEWIGECRQAVNFTGELQRIFFEAREELLYRNRLIENRLAVAEQLNEVARLIQRISGDVSDICTVPTAMEEKIRKQLQKQNIVVKQVWMLSKADEKWRIFLTIRARGGQCMTMREVARQLSQVCGCRMVPSKESRAVLNSELRTVLFTEEVNYKVLYGVARVTKERETVSGDNYACACTDEQFVMCLSDGMGSGVEACRESETVVELLEQFVTSGFSRETAARMVNSALVLQRKNGMFSSVDVCSLDLYTGICEFLKAGAATTFIRRSNWVETITSTSMAAGLVQQLDFEKTSKKLYDGDYLVMVTDGVLDALPDEKEEETMKEIILQAREDMPRELGRYILEKVLSYCDYRVQDDMTVLVAGMWKK
ncbi:MAG: SpoIIE family protein phosphatase [Clostridiales bacterium]|nr:SpoIIE family protein phosphatase [Clostridiales bacterium]